MRQGCCKNILFEFRFSVDLCHGRFWFKQDNISFTHDLLNVKKNGKGLAHGWPSLCLRAKKSPPRLFHVPFKLSETCNLCTFCIQIIVNLRNYTLIENIIDIENALMLILLLNNVFAIYCNLLKDCYREFLSHHLFFIRIFIDVFFINV